MSLSKKTLRKKAKNLELKALEKNKINGGRMADLNQLLRGFYVIDCPRKVHYHHRRELIRVFNQMAKEIHGNPADSPSIECFGSFIMDIFSTKSDLDLSINFSGNAVEISRDKKIKTLWKFAKKLYSLQSQGHVCGIQTIMSARVPIVKVIDRGTGIACDLSVENRDGIVKSQIVHIVSTIDERFKMLSLLMKAWAKTHDINSSRERTLNSLSIIAFVAFHLQTRDPPILPPFSVLFKDGANPAAVMKVVQNYLDYGTRNKESLAELFLALFVKLSSVEKLWCEGLCASLYEGSWISKPPNPKHGSINVEDFTDRTENVARAVGRKGFKKIYQCIHHTLSGLLAYMDGQTPLTKVKELLFGLSSTWKGAAANQKRTAEVPIHQNAAHNKRKRLDANNVNNPELHGHQNSQQNKRRRSTEGWEVPQHVKKLKGMQPSESGWGGVQMKSGWGGAQMGSAWGGAQTRSSWERDKIVDGWQGKQPAEVWEQTQLPKHRREQQLAAGGTWQTGGWRGTHLVEGFGVAQPAKGWVEKQSFDGSWLGTHLQGRAAVQPANSWGEKWSLDGSKKPVVGWGKNCEEVGWGGEEQRFVG